MSFRSILRLLSTRSPETIATDSLSPVLKGVTQLYYANGNSVNLIGPDAEIITRIDGQGLIGIHSERVCKWSSTESELPISYCFVSLNSSSTPPLKSGIARSCGAPAFCPWNWPATTSTGKPSVPSAGVACVNVPSPLPR